MRESNPIQPFERDTRLTPEVEQGIDMLAESLLEGGLGSLEAFLDTAARFPRHSLYNQWLIHLQAPQATHLADFDAWAASDYHIAKGQRGIRLLQHARFIRTDEESGEQEEVEAIVGRSVFDVSQLSPEDLTARPFVAEPQPFVNDRPALLARIEQVVTEANMSIVESDASPLERKPRQIALRPGLDESNRLISILLGYAGQLMHFDQEAVGVNAEQRQAEAAAVAFYVARHFGLRMTLAARLAQYFSPNREDLVAQLERIRKTGTRIIKQIEGEGPRGEHTNREESVK